MSNLPLKDELRHIIDNQMWLLREAMAQEKVSLDYEGRHLPPAHFQLPLLKQGLHKWTRAKKELQVHVPHSVQFETKQLERHGTVSSVAEMAQIAPETRRFWLVDMVHHLMSEAIEILENEGRPQETEPRKLSLGKMRKEGWSK